MAKPFQLKIDALLNDIHASGNKSEEILGNHLPAVNIITLRAMCK